jgi:hypothetical protein
MPKPMGEGRELGEDRPQRMLDVLENIARGIEGIAGEMKQLSGAMTSIAGEVSQLSSATIGMGKTLV